MNSKSNELIRGFFLGFIKLHILHHAQEEPLYGKEFKKELQRHGYEISYGTLYPIFHGLERGGYLKSNRITIGGKIRKYYSITPKGVEVFRISIERVRELTDELLG